MCPARIKGKVQDAAAPLDRYSLDLIERDFGAAAIAKLRGARIGMVRHLLRLLDRAAVRQMHRIVFGPT